VTTISGLVSFAVMLATLLIFNSLDTAYAAQNNAVASAFPLSSTTTDPVIISLKRFEQIESYQVTVRSASPQDEAKVIRYSYRKPGYVRMDFTTPHSGAVLIYSPADGKVKLWPFGLGTIPVLHLSPTDSLIQDGNGHRVDQSDLGVLLNNIRSLQQGGTTTAHGEEFVAGKSTLHISVVGAGGKTIDAVHQYEIWFDKQNGLPVKVVSYAFHGKRLETVLMDAMVINLHFPPDFFAP
jgi:outer membrane lipoprotein-sorting protein